MIASQLLRESLQAGERLHTYELRQSLWRDFGKDTTDYAKTFAGFLRLWNVENFADLIALMRHPVSVLDIAAPVESFLATHADQGISLSLTDVGSYDRTRFTTVEGHILQRKTWRQLESVMAQRGIKAFHLIICRPFAGMVDYSPEFAAFYYSILRRAYRLLSTRYGILMSEVPDFSGVDMGLKQLVHDLMLRGVGVHLLSPDQQREYGRRYALMVVRTIESDKAI